MIRALQSLLGRAVSMRNRSSKVFGPVIALLLAGALTCPPSPARADPLDAQEVEASADATFDGAFAAHRFWGLVISVVQNDRVLFTKGYGFADYAAQTPGTLSVYSNYEIGLLGQLARSAFTAQRLEAYHVEETAP